MSGGLSGVRGGFGAPADAPALAEPVPAAFLQLNDSTKNRILTAQGVLLLLCAAGPGLLLLFRVSGGHSGDPALNSAPGNPSSSRNP